MSRQNVTHCDVERITRLREAFELAVLDSRCNASHASSAAASFLICLFIMLLKVGKPGVAVEMQRIASVLTALAAAAGDPDEIDRVATALSDVPNAPRAS